VQRNYEDIGGGSPILHWTEVQGQGMCERLDALSPETAPHRFYVAFRYIDPSSEDALRAMHADGVTRAVAFTQYPQFSCSTTGSSLNELWRAARRLGLDDAFEWSVIDRWPTHERFVDAMTKTVEDGLAQFDENDRDDVVIVFSAHSLPLSVIDRGDPYPAEIGATVHEVMRRLDYRYEYLISYQSEVGPVRWLGPSTETVIEELGSKRRTNVLVVGIAFTSDHIETLHELDIEYGELAQEHGITHYRRAPALNGMPLFQDALAEIVHQHLASGEACSRNYGLRCPGCVNPQCRAILNPVAPFKRTPVTTSPKNKLYPTS
jgi:protoporphyrin/coproporphyrin ferrochelatase